MNVSLWGEEIWRIDVEIWKVMLLTENVACQRRESLKSEKNMAVEKVYKKLAIQWKISHTFKLTIVQANWNLTKVSQNTHVYLQYIWRKLTQRLCNLDNNFDPNNIYGSKC